MTSTNTTQANVLYPVANGTVSSNPFVDYFASRDPTSNDVNYPVQKKWLNTASGSFWELQNFITTQGIVTANWIKIGSTSLVEGLQGNSGGAVFPNPSSVINVVGDGTFITTVGTPLTNTLTIEPGGGLATSYVENTGTAVPSGGVLNVLGGTAISTSGSGATITINATATVATTYTGNTGTAVPALNNLNILGGAGINTTGSGSTITINATGSEVAYTNVTHAMSPYTVLTTDYYLSVDCSGGTVTLNFPNAPAAKEVWIVKDRTGSAATNHISITTPGGTVTFDGQTTYTINTNYESIELLANSTPTYEVF